MIKAILPYLYTGAIVTATGGTGYLLAERNGFLETEEPAQLGLLQQNNSGDKTQKLIIKEPSEGVATTQTDAVAEGQAPPSFSTLRVEPDGSTVIAGQGPEASEIEILNGENVIATTKAAPNGDFVVILDMPLAPGAHSLTLRAKPEGKGSILSQEAGLINVPTPGTQEEVTVLVAEADKPTRVLQKPEAQLETSEINTEVVSNTASASVPLVKPESKPNTDEQVASLDKQIDISTTEVEAPKEEIQIPVLIEAADVENSRIFIAGKGEAGKSVNLYLNSKFLGAAKITKNNAFLFEGDEALIAGSYELRADMFDAKTGKVVARAEVNLLHEPVVEPVQTTSEVVTENTVETAKPEVAVVAENKVEDTQEVAALKPVPKVAKDLTAKVESNKTDEQVIQTAAELDQSTKKPVIKTGSSVIIRRGDSLWRVASRNYGNGVRYTTIFDANRDQVRNPNLIFPGQVLKVPEEQQTANANNSG